MKPVRAKKHLSQNFLQDQTVVQKIIAAAEIVSGETILEIGPGTGVLTQALVDAGARVIAVEKDEDLIAPLQERFGHSITLIHSDVLELDLGAWVTSVGGDQRQDPSGFRYKLIANIPYHLTSAILEHFLSTDPKPSRMIVMVQREVADRILAKPQQMSVLSVACQLYADCKKVANVPAGAFRPMPKVDSAVVRLDIFSPPYSAFAKASAEGVRGGLSDDPESIIRLAKIGFSSPRKQLHGNLAAGGCGTSMQIKAVLEQMSLNPLIRAEGLTVEQWKELYRILHTPCAS